MRHKPPHVLVRHTAEEISDVHFNEPLRAFLDDDLLQPSQRLMRIPPRSEPIGAAPKLRLPNRLQNTAEPILDDPVLKARNPYRTLAAVGFRNVHPTRGLRAIAHPP